VADSGRPLIFLNRHKDCARQRDWSTVMLEQIVWGFAGIGVGVVVVLAASWEHGKTKFSASS